jgi:hypothetical protein
VLENNKLKDEIVINLKKVKFKKCPFLDAWKRYF